MTLDFNYARSLFESSITQEVALCPIQYENVGETQDLENAKVNKTPWVRFVMREGTAFSISLGSNVTRRYPGIGIASIFVAQGEGTAIVREIANRMSNTMLQLNVLGLRIISPYIDIVGKSEDWFQGNLYIPFEVDQTTT